MIKVKIVLVIKVQEVKWSVKVKTGLVIKVKKV